eukprot:CAMPEP_0197024214 /NCGR_PEP_ID=MMETSP1384-20130603/4824_1 /TAXON_ID=29189 /ORGANISM="Ammonia sp." /LENGTH=133 /DNA_ID=CAMNT_0042452563 /DNA_START=453 /DNA_END=854 /DNA_ORIENTATION=+
MTFDAVEQWRDEFLHHADVEDQQSFPFLLLGNKSDLGGTVSKADVNRWIQQRGYKNMKYLETSALNNTNITEAFDQVARLCLANCAHDLVYVPSESQQIIEEHDDHESITLEDVMSNTDELASSSSMCGCQLL